MSARRYNQSLPHLIVGGTTKAGTSSVFTYLAAHPQVCPATLKETRYFLDEDYPLPRAVDPRKRDYGSYFSAYEEGQVCVEATPDYLHSLGTPDRLCRNLTDVRIVFILREPVSRLISWFRFARQRDLLPPDMTFTDYVNYQLVEAPGANDAQHFLALKQGRYSNYLASYLHLFPDRVAFVWFEQLRDDPRSVMTSLADFAGIESDFFRNVDFEVVNRTSAVRSQHLHGKLVAAGRHLRNFVHRYPRVHNVLRVGKRFVTPAYDVLNRGAHDTRVDVSEPFGELLHDYYRNEPTRLVELTGQRPPWFGKYS